MQGPRNQGMKIILWPSEKSTLILPSCDCPQLSEEKKMASDNAKSLEMEVVTAKTKLTHSEGILFIYTYVSFTDSLIW